MVAGISLAVLCSFALSIIVRPALRAAPEPPPLAAPRAEASPRGSTPHRELTTFLLVGLDTPDQEVKKAPVRSDVIIVGALDAQAGKVSLISIPRDTYVYIPDRGMDKINHAFAFGGGTRGDGGVKLLQQTVMRFLGLPRIDSYVVIDMNTIVQMVDAIGGITVRLDRSVWLDENTQLPKGEHRLNGHQALLLVRQRKLDPQGDFGRIKNQQAFLRGVLEEFRSVGMNEKLSLASYALKHVRTNVSLTYAVGMMNSLKDLTVDDITSYIIPGTDLWLKGIAYVKPDLNRTVEIAQEVFGVENKKVKVRGAR